MLPLLSFIIVRMYKHIRRSPGRTAGRAARRKPATRALGHVVRYCTNVRYSGGKTHHTSHTTHRVVDAIPAANTRATVSDSVHHVLALQVEGQVRRPRHSRPSALKLAGTV